MKTYHVMHRLTSVINIMVSSNYHYYIYISYIRISILITPMNYRYPVVLCMFVAILEILNDIGPDNFSNKDKTFSTI